MWKPNKTKTASVNGVQFLASDIVVVVFTSCGFPATNDMMCNLLCTNIQGVLHVLRHMAQLLYQLFSLWGVLSELVQHKLTTPSDEWLPLQDPLSRMDLYFPFCCFHKVCLWDKLALWVVCISDSCLLWSFLCKSNRHLLETQLCTNQSRVRI